jgi:hypothetical protein
LSIFRNISKFADNNLLEDNELKVVERFKFSASFTGPPMEAMLFLLCAGANLTFGLLGPNIEDLFAHHQPRNSKHLLEHDVDRSDSTSGSIDTDTRTVFLTSIVLNRIMRKLNGDLSNIDLSGTTLLLADLSKLNLSNVNFTDAFISGDASNTDLRSAKLNGAQLEQLFVYDTDLSDSSLYRTHLPSNLISELSETRFEPKENLLKHLNLTGANWWDSAYMADNEEVSEHIFLGDTLHYVSPRFLCPDPETSKRDPHSGLITEMSITICPSTAQLNAMREKFEHAFPRSENEKKRKA